MCVLAASESSLWSTPAESRPRPTSSIHRRAARPLPTLRETSGRHAELVDQALGARAMAGAPQSRSHARRSASCSFSRTARNLRAAFWVSSLRRAIRFFTSFSAASDVDRPGPGLVDSAMGVYSFSCSLEDGATGECESSTPSGGDCTLESTPRGPPVRASGSSHSHRALGPPVSARAVRASKDPRRRQACSQRASGCPVWPRPAQTWRAPAAGSARSPL